jgi:hypothetical protein
MLEPIKRETAKTGMPARRWRRCGASRKDRAAARSRLLSVPVSNACVQRSGSRSGRQSVRKQNRFVRRGEPVKRLERLRLQRHRPHAQPGLRVLEATVRVRAADVDDAGVASMSRCSIPNSSDGRSPVAAAKITIGPVHRTQLPGHGFDLLPRLERRFSFARRVGFDKPRLAGLSSSSPRATARFSTCRSAWVASYV